MLEKKPDYRIVFKLGSQWKKTKLKKQKCNILINKWKGSFTKNINKVVPRYLELDTEKNGVSPTIRDICGFEGTNEVLRIHGFGLGFLTIQKTKKIKIKRKHSMDRGITKLMRHVEMSTLMLPAATMTTMTNSSPIAVAQPKADPVKGTLLNNNNNKQGKRFMSN